MASLDINIEQVDFIIARARDMEDALPRDEHDDESHRGEADNPELISDHIYDSTYQELMGLFETLSEDGLIELVALMWIGRGTYERDEYALALEEARSIGVNRIPDYLLSVQLLADYLEEGAIALGLNDPIEPLSEIR